MLAPNGNYNSKPSRILTPEFTSIGNVQFVVIEERGKQRCLRGSAFFSAQKGAQIHPGKQASLGGVHFAPKALEKSFAIVESFP